MTETHDKIMPGSSSAAITAATGDGISPAHPESIRRQLEEARFISSFIAAVSTSLELDDICSIAARALYRYASYYRIVFTLSVDAEEKIFTFSPTIQKGLPAVEQNTAAGFSSDQPASLASSHLSLLDELGSIAIYFKSGGNLTYSESLLASVGTSFGQAVKNALEHNRMRDLAMRDGLTGLFNRRVFDETLAQKVKSPDMRPISLLLIDLDNFKQVNDIFGHQAGDQVLKTVAMILKESCRGHDLVARFGGEEFAVVLSRTEAVTAQAIAQRIRNRLAKTEFIFDNRQLQMTASIGLATCRTGNSIFTANLVIQADRALYDAKRSGKNRVCVFPNDLLAGENSSSDGENYGMFASVHC